MTTGIDTFCLLSEVEGTEKLKSLSFHTESTDNVYIDKDSKGKGSLYSWKSDSQQECLLLKACTLLVHGFPANRTSESTGFQDWKLWVLP